MSWIVVGAVAVMGTVSVVQAQRQNQAVKRSMRSSNEAERIQLLQNARQSANDQQKNVNDMERIIGKLRVAAGSAGVTGYGSTERQATLEAGSNAKILKSNLQMGTQFSLSQLSAQQASLEGQGKSVVLSGIQGAAQGAMMGLAISNALAGLSAAGAGTAWAGGGETVAPTLFEAPSALPVAPVYA